MLIQIFKPYVDVKIIGSTTYGKPVGFFGIRIDQYTVYYSSFHIRNADGEGDYYDGILPDLPATDDIGYDFGDIRENSVAAVLQDMQDKFKSAKLLSVPQSIAEIKEYHVSGIYGMVEDRVHLKDNVQ